MPWVLGSVGWGFEGKVKGYKRGLSRYETVKQKGEEGGGGIIVKEARAVQMRTECVIQVCKMTCISPIEIELKMLYI